MKMNTTLNQKDFLMVMLIGVASSLIANVIYCKLYKNDKLQS